MSRFVKYIPCERCRENGRDLAGDNFAVYSDGGGHCFSCGHHKFSSSRLPLIEERQQLNANIIPNDFSREIPGEAWKWLLQYGLSWRYWLPYVGWSEKDMRLVFTVGEPSEFSIGRYFGKEDKRKWWVYGNCHKTPHIFGYEKGNSVALVEDIISAHKVGQICSTISLFGTKIFDSVIPCLRQLKLPVIMWLDNDQRSFAAKRAAWLSTVTELPVRYVFTTKDPKCLSLDEIKDNLK